MKKILSVFLASIMMLSILAGLCGCGTARATLNGTNLKKFVIVYPEYGNDIEMRAAEYLQKQIKEITGVTLPLVSDAEKEAEHEIIVGAADRKLADVAQRPSCGEMEYVIASNEGSVALYGEIWAVAGAAYSFINNYITGAEFKAEIPESQVIAHKPEAPNNFIMLIGDGMGEVQTLMPELLDFPYDKEEFVVYEEDHFFGYDFPYFGYSRTDSYTGTTDSAAGGTALATGYKTVNKYIGMDKDLNPVQNLSELAIELGKSAAVMSTDSYDGATPSAFYAHSSSRNNGKDILAQKDALLADETMMISCNFDGWMITSIEDEIVRVMDLLCLDEDGFFIMYEEAHIDKRCHKEDVEGTHKKMLRFNRAIAVFMEYVMYNPDTLILITADHETGGMKTSGRDVFYTRSSHSSADVPVFAYGIGGEYYDGQTMENIDVAKYFAKLMGKDDFGMPYAFEPSGVQDNIVDSFDD
jgi:alkaline phosphatase